MIKIYVNDKDFEMLAETYRLHPESDYIHVDKIRFIRNKYVRIKLPGDFIVSAEYEAMEKSKMTREEALERTGFIKGNKDIIAALEALGLLKFEEFKIDWHTGIKASPSFTVMEAIKICRSTYTENDAFVAGLEKHGYKIVPV